MKGCFANVLLLCKLQLCNRIKNIPVQMMHGKCSYIEELSTIEASNPA